MKSAMWLVALCSVLTAACGTQPNSTPEPTGSPIFNPDIEEAVALKAWKGAAITFNSYEAGSGSPGFNDVRGSISVELHVYNYSPKLCGYGKLTVDSYEECGSPLNCSDDPSESTGWQDAMEDAPLGGAAEGALWGVARLDPQDSTRYELCWFLADEPLGQPEDPDAPPENILGLSCDDDPLFRVWFDSTEVPSSNRLQFYDSEILVEHDPPGPKAYDLTIATKPLLPIDNNSVVGCPLTLACDWCGSWVNSQCAEPTPRETISVGPEDINSFTHDELRWVVSPFRGFSFSIDNHINRNKTYLREHAAGLLTKEHCDVSTPSTGKCYSLAIHASLRDGTGNWFNDYDETSTGTDPYDYYRFADDEPEDPEVELMVPVSNTIPAELALGAQDGEYLYGGAGVVGQNRESLIVNGRPRMVVRDEDRPTDPTFCDFLEEPPPSPPPGDDGLTLVGCQDDNLDENGTPVDEPPDQLDINLAEGATPIPQTWAESNGGQDSHHGYVCDLDNNPATVDICYIPEWDDAQVQYVIADYAKSLATTWGQDPRVAMWKVGLFGMGREQNNTAGKDTGVYIPPAFFFPTCQDSVDPYDAFDLDNGPPTCDTSTPQRAASCDFYESFVGKSCSEEVNRWMYDYFDAIAGVKVSGGSYSGRDSTVPDGNPWWRGTLVADIGHYSPINPNPSSSTYTATVPPFEYSSEETVDWHGYPGEFSAAKYAVHLGQRVESSAATCEEAPPPVGPIGVSFKSFGANRLNSLSPQARLSYTEYDQIIAWAKLDHAWRNGPINLAPADGLDSFPVNYLNYKYEGSSIQNPLGTSLTFEGCLSDGNNSAQSLLDLADDLDACYLAQGSSTGCASETLLASYEIDTTACFEQHLLWALNHHATTVGVGSDSKEADLENSDSANGEYAGPGDPSLTYGPNYLEMLKATERWLGYRLTLSEAFVVPQLQVIDSDMKLRVSTTWENYGVAPSYRPLYPIFRLARRTDQNFDGYNNETIALEYDGVAQVADPLPTCAPWEEGTATPPPCALAGRLATGEECTDLDCSNDTTIAGWAPDEAWSLKPEELPAAGAWEVQVSLVPDPIGVMAARHVEVMDKIADEANKHVGEAFPNKYQAVKGWLGDWNLPLSVQLPISQPEAEGWLGKEWLEWELVCQNSIATDTGCVHPDGVSPNLDRGDTINAVLKPTGDDPAVIGMLPPTALYPEIGSQYMGCDDYQSGSFTDCNWFTTGWRAWYTIGQVSFEEPE